MVPLGMEEHVKAIWVRCL